MVPCPHGLYFDIFIRFGMRNQGLPQTSFSIIHNDSNCEFKSSQGMWLITSAIKSSMMVIVWSNMHSILLESLFLCNQNQNYNLCLKTIQIFHSFPKMKVIVWYVMLNLKTTAISVYYQYQDFMGNIEMQPFLFVKWYLDNLK